MAFIEKYDIPVFLFINKMDQNGTDADALLAQLQARFSEECIDFGAANTEEFYEKIAVAEEQVLNYFRGRQSRRRGNTKADC